MMRHLALCVLVVIGLGGLAYAEDEEAPPFRRGFEDGKFVDDYFGIVYEAPGLEEGFASSTGGQGALWSGKADGGATVELICVESGEKRKGADWRALLEKQWAEDGKERKEMKKGAEPQPWVSFVQESLAGFQRHHGYAFFARDHQAFIVHVRIREKSETSDDTLQKTLFNLTVEPESANCFLLAHYLTARSQGDPRDPKAVLIAATGTRSPQGFVPGYATQDSPFYSPELALRALAYAKKNLDFGELPVDQRWQVYQTLGLMQLTTGKREESIPAWKTCIELAPQTANPGASGMNAHYNLACAYSLLGRLDEAFAALEKAFELGAPDEVAQLKGHGKEDPDLENLRADERWKALVGE